MATLKDKENTDRWFTHNLDLDNRVLFMGSINSSDDSETGVDYLMAEYFIKGMHVLEKNSKPITIIMNNPGGDPLHGLAIYDAIKYSPCHCTIKVYGHAMSMGSVILQAADHRVMMPNSRFMIHFGYDSINGHAKTVEKWIDESKRMNYEMENIYLDMMFKKESKHYRGYLDIVLGQIMTKQYASGYPPPTKPIEYNFSKLSIPKRYESIRMVLRDMLNFDTILNAQETIQLGFADEIFGLKS
jgi:ATP-dependent protease ClpP protease subunit